jgi:hypothetical protein
MTVIADLARGGIIKINFIYYIYVYCSALESSSVDKTPADTTAWGGGGP